MVAVDIRATNVEVTIYEFWKHVMKCVLTAIPEFLLSTLKSYKMFSLNGSPIAIKQVSAVPDSI